MTHFAQTLWDLIRAPKRSRATVRAPQREAVASNGSASPRRRSMQDKYDALVEEMKRTHDVRIRKWRTSSSGMAWAIRYADGKIVKLVSAPFPRGPMSCAIFLHEIGHHAIGLGAYQPRCLEEYHAWAWALATMRRQGFNVTPAVEKRMEKSLRYAVEKARRRGLRKLPEELIAYAR